MIDRFSDHTDSVGNPSRRPFAVQPSDDVPLPAVPKALYVGTGGTVVLRGIDATEDVRFVNVAAGSVLDVRASHVRGTGTTAADLVGLA